MTASPILTPAQQTIIRLFGEQEDLCDRFVLSGGTALAAFHLNHRRSDDLDFFSQEPVDDLRIRRFAEESLQTLGGGTFESSRLYDRHLFQLSAKGAPVLKLEFTQYPYPSLADPSLHEGLRVESLRDIAADKLAALLDRFEPKDFYDLYFLLRDGKNTLPKMRADLEKKFSLRADPIVLGAAFARAKDLPVLPHLVQPVDEADVTAFFIDLARTLKEDVVEE